MVFNIPNLITILRILIVPFLVYALFYDYVEIAFWLFVFAGLSDAVDGFLAKWMQQTSVLGAYLDPIADKILLVSIYATLGLRDHIALWLVFIVILRDVLLAIGTGFLRWLVDSDFRIYPLWISKINTALQIGLAALVIARLGLFKIEHNLFYEVLTYCVAFTTIASFIAYFVKFREAIVRGVNDAYKK